MSRSVLSLALVLLAGASAAAGDPPVMVRCEASQEATPWVGQRVALSVTLLTRTSFETAPAFDLPRISGAVLIAPRERPVLGTEQIGEGSYTSARHELSLFVLRPGRVRVPPFTIRFRSASEWGAPAEARTLTTAPLEVEAALPPGAQGLRSLVCATKLSAEQTFTPQAGQVRVGDAVRRQVRLSAGGVPGMILPATLGGSVAGASVYPEDPRVSEEAERGEGEGVRVDAVTYVFTRPGATRLPGLVLRWWNLEASRLETLRLPGATYRVLPASPPQAAQPEAEGVAPWRLLAAGLAALATLGVALAALARRRRAELDSEAGRFRALLAACAADDPRRALSAAYRWLSRDVGVATLEALEPELPSAVREAALTAAITGGPWDGRELRGALRKVRASLGPQRGRGRAPLAPLNPEHESR